MDGPGHRPDEKKKRQSTGFLLTWVSRQRCQRKSRARFVSCQLWEVHHLQGLPVGLRRAFLQTALQNFRWAGESCPCKCALILPGLAMRY